MDHTTICMRGYEDAHTSGKKCSSPLAWHMLSCRLGHSAPLATRDRPRFTRRSVCGQFCRPFRTIRMQCLVFVLRPACGRICAVRSDEQHVKVSLAPQHLEHHLYPLLVCKGSSQTPSQLASHPPQHIRCHCVPHHTTRAQHYINKTLPTDLQALAHDVRSEAPTRHGLVSTPITPHYDAIRSCGSGRTTHNSCSSHARS